MACLATGGISGTFYPGELLIRAVILRSLLITMRSSISSRAMARTGSPTMVRTPGLGLRRASAPTGSYTNGVQADVFITAALDARRNFLLTGTLSGSDWVFSVNTLQNAPAGGGGGGGGGGGLTQQQVADSLKLAPSAGDPAAGSAMALLSDIDTTLGITPIQVKRPIRCGWGHQGSAQAAIIPTRRGCPFQFGIPAGFADLTGSTPTMDIAAVVGGLPSATPAAHDRRDDPNGQLRDQWPDVYEGARLPRPTSAQTADLTNWSPNAYVYRVRAIWISPAKVLSSRGSKPMHGPFGKDERIESQTPIEAAEPIWTPDRHYWRSGPYTGPATAGAPLLGSNT